jgi:hypothetical protein
MQVKRLFQNAEDMSIKSWGSPEVFDDCFDDCESQITQPGSDTFGQNFFISATSTISDNENTFSTYSVNGKVLKPLVESPSSSISGDKERLSLEPSFPLPTYRSDHHSTHHSNGVMSWSPPPSPISECARPSSEIDGDFVETM